MKLIIIFAHNTQGKTVLLNKVREFIETQAWMCQTFFICLQNKFY